MDLYTLNRVKKNINTIVRGLFTYNGFKYLRLYPVTEEKKIINDFLDSIISGDEGRGDAMMSNKDNYLLLIIMDGEDQIIKLIIDSEVDHPILDGRYKLGTIMNNIVINNKSFLRKHD